MKKQIKQLISEVACKDLTFGCEVRVSEKLNTCTHHFVTTIISKWNFPERVNVYGGSIAETKDKYGLVTIDKTKIEKIIGHPVMFGDILEAMKKLKILTEEQFFDVFDAWMDCGFTKSLNELYAEEWEKVCPNCIGLDMCECDVAQKESYETEVPKKKEIKELFKFLISLESWKPQN